MRPRIATLLWIFLAKFSLLTAHSHQTSDSYLALQLTNNQIEGRWAIAIRDLNHVLEIDTDKDGEISDPELEKAKPNIENYSYNRLKISSDGQSTIFHHRSYQIQETDSAIYLVLLFDSEKREKWPDLLIEYNLFFDTDPLHRGLLRLDLPQRTETTIFNPANPVHRFILDQSKPQTTNTFRRFLQEGVWHIWIGFDHVLFLIALLLPSVLERLKNAHVVPALAGSQWAPSPNLQHALLRIIKIVTAFTVAHSITLTLATLGYVHLPSRLIEPVIAVSVLLAALHNLKPIFPERTWTIAFAFGLVHGFGFATVLSELNLPRATLGFTLLAFNLGVELGQLAIVLAFVPIAFAIRRTALYRIFILRFGSAIIAFLAAFWLFQRVSSP